MKGITKYFLSFLTALFFFGTILSQTNLEMPSDSELQMKPTPTSSKLGEFGSHPVSLNTGAPSINIPIYKIAGKDLSLDISLAYNGNGIKVSEIASWAGLGWNLNTGGIITRKINGLPDEVSYFQHFDWYENHFSSNNYFCGEGECPDEGEADRIRLEKVVNGLVDLTPDKYNYHFGTHSGEMFFSTDKIAQTFPFENIKVDYNPNVFNGNWEITDENGIIYIFKNSDAEKISNPPSYNGSVFPTAWYISEINNKDFNEKISFVYENGTDWYEWPDITHSHTKSGTNINYTAQGYFNYCEINNSGYGNHPYMPSIITPIEPKEVQLTKTKYLKKISFTRNKKLQEEIIFHSSERNDDIENGNSVRRLDSICTKSFVSDLKKTFVFNNMTYFGNGENKEKRMKLTSLIEKNSSEIKEYTFDYNNIKMPEYNSFNIDHWGYYNGANNSTYFPRYGHEYDGMFSSVLTTNANRETNNNTVKACILEKITYPTKGYTEFDWEVNKVKIGSNTMDVGGVRIKQIKKYDGINKTSIYCEKYFYVKNYNKDNEEISGELFTTGKHFYLTKGNVKLILTSYLVTEDGLPTENRGYHVGYNEVVKQINNGEGGYIISKFQNGTNGDMFRDVLDEVVVLNSIQDTVKHTKYFYTFVDNNNFLPIKTIKTNVIYFQRPGYFISTEYKCVQATSVPPPDFGFRLDKTNSRSKWLGLDSISEKIFLSNNKFIENKTRYTYGGMEDINDELEFIHTNPTKIETISSDNTTTSVFYKYPLDYDNIPNLSPINKLIEQHSINTRIEGYTKTDGKITGGILNTFKIKDDYVYPNKIYRTESPTSFQASHFEGNNFVFDNSYKLNSSFDKYDDDDYGNIQQYHKKDDIPTTIIWGYNDTNPIAKLEGVEYNQLKTTQINKIKELDATVWTFENKVDLKNLNEEIRNMLPEVMITTYTYRPLYGQETVTTPNGITTFYEYDSSARLKTIRDQDGNVIKQIDYHYTNPLECASFADNSDINVSIDEAIFNKEIEIVDGCQDYSIEVEDINGNEFVTSVLNNNILEIICSENYSCEERNAKIKIIVDNNEIDYINLTQQGKFIAGHLIYSSTSPTYTVEATETCGGELPYSYSWSVSETNSENEVYSWQDNTSSNILERNIVSGTHYVVNCTITDNNGQVSECTEVSFDGGSSSDKNK